MLRLKPNFIGGSLRSGQRVEFEGSLVILGDVNAGAEVVAGENVVVVGILRGLACWCKRETKRQL